MSSDVAITVDGVSKHYNIYAAPHDRLKQMVVPRIQRLIGLTPTTYFRSFQALSNVSLELRRGEVVGILGKNGSGKSTLLQIICGTLTPSSGSVATHGRIAALLELGAGFNPEFTGRQNAILNATILGLGPQEIERRLPEIEAFADVGEFFDRPMTTYSSGMYVRVAFAVQACIDPDILVIDEALAVGDAQFQAKCHKRLKRLRENGTSILFVSHDTGSVRTLCDRAVWLDRGAIRMAGSVGPVTSEYLRVLFDKDSSDEIPLPQSPDGGVQEVEEEVPVVPIGHWGSHRGIIERVVATNSAGRRTNVFRDRELVNLIVDLRLPPDVPRETLALAFSIKTLSGFDLLVGSTWHDGQISFIGFADKISVRFSFENVFNTGKYMVAVAVEDKTQVSPVYYEHIEGILFLQTDFTEKHFGIVAPPVYKTIELGH